jgi:hypothetical protein
MLITISLYTTGKAFFKEQNGTTVTPCAKKKAPFLRKKAKTGLFL